MGAPGRRGNSRPRAKAEGEREAAIRRSGFSAWGKRRVERGVDSGVESGVESGKKVRSRKNAKKTERQDWQRENELRTTN